MEMEERQRKAAAEEQQRLEYERMMEERRMLLHRRQQLDILERQQQEELRFRKGNAMQEPGTGQGFVNPLYSNYHNTRGRGAPRGRGGCMPPPPNWRQHEDYIGAIDGDIVNPLYHNYHHNNTRGRGTPRGRVASMPPPPNVPPPRMLPPHMPPPPIMSTPPPQTAERGRGSVGRGGGNGRGYSGFGAGGVKNHRHVSPQFEPPPPGEDLGDGANRQEADHGKKLPPQGRPGDWECGYCANINFAREDTMFKTFSRSRRSRKVKNFLLKNGHYFYN